MWPGGSIGCEQLTRRMSVHSSRCRIRCSTSGGIFKRLGGVLTTRSSLKQPDHLRHDACCADAGDCTMSRGFEEGGGGGVMHAHNSRTEQACDEMQVLFRSVASST